MPLRKLHFALIAAGMLVIAAAIWLGTARPASAQCGSQASSCKNCHEVQSQDPVNAKGDWHIQHAFIDACVVCHAGNDQAVDKDAAHTGMVPPLADVQASCSRCHPTDTLELAQTYAATLGVEVGTGSGTSGGGGAAGQGATPVPTPPPADAGGSTVVVEDQNVIDYAARYDQTAGGQAPVSWGNVIVGLLLALVVVGGVGFALWNERRLHRKSSPKEQAPEPAAEGAAREQSALGSLPSLRPEVLELLPLLQALEPRTLHALKQILQATPGSSELLIALARINPRLVAEVSRLDQHEVRLLVALAQDT